MTTRAEAMPLTGNRRQGASSLRDLLICGFVILAAVVLVVALLTSTVREAAYGIAGCLVGYMIGELCNGVGGGGRSGSG